MYSRIAARRISDALRVGALVGLLAVVTGCSSAPASQSTPIPTSAVSVPTEAPTEALPTSEPQATSTVPALPSETPALPTSSPTLLAVDTPIPTVVASTPVPVGDLQWKQIALAGNNITDLSYIAEGTNVSVLAAGPKGVWTSTYDYTQWDKHDVVIADQARNAEAIVASPDVMYVTSHTGCPSGLPSSRSRSTDGGKTWQEMTGEAMSITASNATIAYGAKCSGLNKTTDAGATWTDLSIKTQSSDPISLAASPDGQTVYAAYVSEGGTGQIWVSKDGGGTWTDVTPRNVPQEGFLAPDNLTFVAGSEGRPDDGGLYLTNNEGVWFLPAEGGDWKMMQKPKLPTDTEGTFSNFTALFVDTAYSADFDKPGPVIYASRSKSTESALVGQGVFSTSDMGATWQSVGKGLETHVVNGIALIPYDASTGRVEMLLAATDDGVWAITMPPSSH